MTQKNRGPVTGRRYLIIAGRNKGRLMKVAAVNGDTNTAIKVRGHLCDAWGDPTDMEVVVLQQEIEV